MQLIAHRGASGYAPENTMAAFALALKMGAKAIELDVHQTADQKLVVIHDDDLKRVGGDPARVANLSWRELSKFDIGSWFDRRFEAERVPLLEEVMDLTKDKAELHVEIKAGSRVYPGIEERLTALIEKRKSWKETLISSFDHEALYQVRFLEAKARLGYLRGRVPLSTAWRELSELEGESLNMSLRQVDEKTTGQAHKRGFKLLIYTVNAQKDIIRLRKMGVDGVFTNFPDISDDHDYQRS